MIRPAIKKATVKNMAMPIMAAVPIVVWDFGDSEGARGDPVVVVLGSTGSKSIPSLPACSRRETQLGSGCAGNS